MGKIAVIYRSKYGASRQYAKWISSALDADLFPLDKKTAEVLSEYSTIIFGAGLYASSISGFSQFREVFKKHKDKRYILFTVGISSTVNTENFKSITDRAFCPEMHAKIKVFHFRGELDYNRLNRFHRAVMWALVKVLSRKKALSDDEKQVIASYGKTVSFLDEDSIEPLLAYLSDFEE